MFDALKPLLESGIVNEETRVAIAEAWETKLSEAREEIRAEMRDEFSQKFDHDKGVMVEALDKMVTENLTTEIEEFQAEKKQLAEDRAKFNVRMVEASEKFDKFMVTKLTEGVRRPAPMRISHRREALSTTCCQAENNHAAIFCACLAGDQPIFNQLSRNLGGIALGDLQ